MSRMSKSSLCLAVSALAFVVAGAIPAHADEAANLQTLQNQINALQKQLAEIQAAQAKKAAEPVIQQAPVVKQAQTKASGEVRSAPSTQPASVADTSSIHGVIKAKTGIDLTLGGFLDATSIYRTRNESADVGSNFNTAIPFNNAAAAHEGEFRETARATRISLLGTAQPDADTKLTGFVETDFQAAASTSTSTQTNGYALRLRQAFGEYENNPWGLHVMAGQGWSLVTMTTQGLDPLKYDAPIVIDSSYVPGFNFTRNTQIRIVKDFDDKKLWLGISAESPQAELNGVCTSSSNPSNSPSLSASACGSWNNSYLINNSSNTSSFSSSTVTTDIAPDVIVKAAYDPGYGHYEIFGLARFFHDNVNTNYHNNTYLAGGGGAGAILPIVPQMVDIQANVMAGEGIGRYGAAQLPDFAVAPNGSLKPLKEYTALFGVIAHPIPDVDTYLYAGMEQEFRDNALGTNNDTFGYGNFNVNNANCNTQNSQANGAVAAGCFAQTSSVWQVTPGIWYRAYNGNYGKVQIGLQDSWTRRNTFADGNGNRPHGIENVTMLSFRYYPF